MGYDPTDYFDFGNFNQNGTTETRFGSKTELTSLITAAHTENIKVYADIVINHNSGGASEYNQYTKTNTWTNFTGVKSGLFKRTQHDFHPNWVHSSDEGAFGGFRICVMKFHSYRTGFGNRQTQWQSITKTR